MSDKRSTTTDDNTLASQSLSLSEATALCHALVHQVSSAAGTRTLATKGALHTNEGAGSGRGLCGWVRRSMPFEHVA